FSAFQIGSRLKLVNLLRMRGDGRGPTNTLTLAQALAGDPNDPVIGPVLEFRVVGSVPSVDVPRVANVSTSPDLSHEPALLPRLTCQLRGATSSRTGMVECGRAGNGD